MGLSTIIPSIFFGLVGLFIIGFTIKLLLSALIGNPWQWLERQKVTGKEKHLREGDHHFQNDQFEKAISAWKNAFYLDRINHLPSLVEKAHNQNMNVLGRLLNLSEKRSAHIINLAAVEKLIGARTELLHTFFETSVTLKKLRLRKKDAATKSSPDWALQEFSKKHQEVKQKIGANRTSLEAELKKLFDSLNQISGNSGITYH